MGFFVNLVGELTCLRCRRVSTACIQTKLLRHEADNSCREYRVGEGDEMVGLEDYCPLDPWDGRSALVVAVGDWDCDHCGLNWQWARAEFEVQPTEGYPVATLREFVGLEPWQASDLERVHYAESWLAELSGIWPTGADYRWWEGFELWQACPLAERRERVAAGFRAWCREVAGVRQETTPDAAPDPREK